MKQNVTRIVFYDWFRIIATLFVIIGHSAYLSIKTQYGGVNYTLPVDISPAYDSLLLTFFRGLASWVYTFHMPLFFFLSGAVLRLKPLQKFDDFCISKIKKLLIPYIICSFAFMLPIKYIAGFYTRSNFMLALKDVGNTLSESGHLWFLPVLFFCMISFYIIKKILEHFKCDNDFILLFISIFYPILLNNINLDIFGFKSIFTFLTVFNYFFWFVLGYVFEKYRNSLKIEKKLPLFLILIAFIIISYFNFKYSFLNNNIAIIVGILGTIIISNVLSILFNKFTNN